MSISTFSIFYPTVEVTSSNRYFNFDEGGGELTATVSIGSYTLTDLATAVKTALDAAGGQTYTVSLNRSTRAITISATSNFSILLSSGTQVGTSIFSDIGFTSGSDLSGTNSYTGASGAGTEYYNQFILQDYVDKDHYQEKIDVKVNESGSGTIEVVSFGTREFFEMSFMYVTNKPGDGRVIKNNPTGVSDFVNFMQNITQKGPIEFMPDIGTRSTYHKLVLESTPGYKDGTGYRLNELQNLAGYYEIKNVKFRVVS